MTSPRGFGNPLLTLGAYALGTAAGSALRPEAQELANLAWQKVQTLPLDPVLLAQGVAQGQIARDWAATEATNMGVNGERFDRLVQVFDTGPGVATAFQLWRRGVIDAAGFRRAVKREGLEEEWIADLEALREVLLSSDELAMMQQQGFITAGRANEEAAKQGVTAERQQLRFQTSGLPPGLEMAFELLRRSIISRDEFAQIVREGHTKTKYTDELLALEKRVLSAAEYASARLRQWVTKEEADAGGAKTGYTPEDMELLFLNRGRPASPTQIWNAWARGVVGPRGVPTDYEDHAKAIAISDIRPEYAELLWGIRWNYPSLFQLRGAVQAGGISPARALEIMHKQRYEAQDAEPIVASWTKAGKVSGRDLTQAQLATEFEGFHISEAQYRDALTRLAYDPEEIDLLVALGEAARIRKYRDAVVERAHKLFTKHMIDEAQARAALTADGIPGDSIDQLLRLWTIERDIDRPTLTAAQVKAAYKKSVLTREQALAELEERGYSAADAATYLDS